MEHSKVRLLIRDIASKGSSQWVGNRQVVETNNSNNLQIYRIKRIGHTTWPCQQTHIPSVHDHNTSCHNNAPMIHASFFFPYIQFLIFHICMSFSSSLQLTWLADPALVTLVYPNWIQYMPHALQEAFLLGGVNASVRGNGRRFSKTSSYPPCCRYASILFYPYFLMTTLSPVF